FLLHFSRYLGFAPHENYSVENCFFEMSEGVFIASQSVQHVMNQRESALLNELMHANQFQKSLVKVTRTERQEMLKHLLKYYQLHLENFRLKSTEVLEVIFD